MKIIFAKHIGFCSGVKRAISIAEESFKERRRPIQFLGSLVHNEKVVGEFEKKGVKFVKSFKEVKKGILIIQAHGVPPFSEKVAKKVLIKDATCPLVRKAQLTALSFYKKGYKVIIVGDKNHSEVKGINGYIENSAVIIENESQAEKLNLAEFKKIAVIAQTTQNLNRFNKILKILKKKWLSVVKTKRAKGFKGINTICPEVIIRQKELKGILRKSDGILVIGSRSSANTGRLVQAAKKNRKKVIWVNSLEELKKKKMKGISVLGVVSGTSTPNSEVEKIRKYLLCEEKLK